jgi:excisionase family DNA binding protein
MLWPSMGTMSHPIDLLATNGCTMTPPNNLPLGESDRLVYTVTEAAHLLGVSRAFAYELVAKGELPVVRLGRRILVPKLQLHALVDLPATGGRDLPLQITWAGHLTRGFPSTECAPRDSNPKPAD